MTTLGGLIRARAAKLAWEKKVLLAAGLLVVLVTGLAPLIIANGVGRQLKGLTALVAEINAGNTHARAKVLSDEVSVFKLPAINGEDGT